MEGEYLIMVDITHKQNTLRQATATAVIVVSRQETIDAIRNNRVPKGNIFEFSRAAGLLAIKNTHMVIPDCHPLPVEFAAIRHEIHELQLIISVEVRTIYKTGVEVEAMHGASITALTIYDMLKPIDKKVEIQTIRLEEKKGGKSDYRNEIVLSLKTAVIVCSDTIASGQGEDISGKLIQKKLENFGLTVEEYEVIPDQADIIKAKAIELKDAGYQLVIFSGGTGLSPRDITPETIQPLIDREIPGIMEAARNYGQQRTPYAMLSRGVAGFMGSTLVLTLPGSAKGATETMDAVFPYVFHVFRVAEGMRHQ